MALLSSMLFQEWYKEPLLPVEGCHDQGLNPGFNNNKPNSPTIKLPLMPVNKIPISVIAGQKNFTALYKC